MAGLRSLAIKFSFFWCKELEEISTKRKLESWFKKKQKLILEGAGTDGSEKRGKLEAGAGH